MGALIIRLAQERYASLMDQWIEEDAAKLAVGAYPAPYQRSAIAFEPDLSESVPITNDTASEVVNIANRAVLLERNQFEAANERLYATLKRLAPNAAWFCENRFYPRFEDAAQLRLAGYACRWRGCVVDRNFLGFRKQRF